MLAVVAIVLGTMTATAHQDGGGTTLSHQLVRIRPAQAPSGPSIGVSTVASGKTPEERFHQLLPADQVPAHTPVALLWRGDSLSSPDRIVVKSTHRQGQAIDVQIEVRRFDGTLHANVVTVPVVEVELGELDPGRYEVSVSLTELVFTDIDHPEGATRPTTKHVTFSFVVV